VDGGVSTGAPTAAPTAAATAAPSLGLVHTVPALATTFGDLLRERAPGARLVHVVDAWLLETAIADGVTAQVARQVADHVGHLVAAGADAVLVTCSSIGEAAEAAGVRRGVPVLRVDAPMAREAAVLATAPGARGRIAVLATLDATLGPTGRLVARALHEASGRGAGPRDDEHREVRVDAQVVDGAAAARAAGDLARHDDLVAAAVRRVAQEADVVVLAQASMAGAAADAGVDVPVLTSPASGADALVAAARRQRPPA
jgi:aspartate/glutamate racemase